MSLKKITSEQKNTHTHTKESQKRKRKRKAYWTSCLVNLKKMKKKKKKSEKESNVGEGTIVHGHFRPGRKHMGFTIYFPSSFNQTLQKSFPSHFLFKVFHPLYFTSKQTHPKAIISL